MADLSIVSSTPDPNYKKGSHNSPAASSSAPKQSSAPLSVVSSVPDPALATDDRSLFQKGKDWLAGTSGTPNVVSRFASSFDNASAGTDNPSEAWQGVKMAVQHPSLEADALKDMGQGVWSGMKNTWNRAGQDMQQAKADWNTPGIAAKGSAAVDLLNAGIHGVESGVPVVGPALANTDQLFSEGKTPEGLGQLTAIAGPVIAGSPTIRGNLSAGMEAVGNAAKAVPEGAKSFVADRATPYLNKPVEGAAPGDTTTNADVLNMKNSLGITPKLSDTGVPGAKPLESNVGKVWGGKWFLNRAGKSAQQPLTQWSGDFLNRVDPSGKVIADMGNAEGIDPLRHGPGIRLQEDINDLHQQLTGIANGTETGRSPNQVAAAQKMWMN